MTVQGMPQLKRRMRAIGRTDVHLRELQLRLIAEAKRNVPRKTGNLGRSIVAGPVSKDSATVEVRANYARFVEEGTGIYGPKKRRITPRTAQALHWKGGATRLSGRSRVSGGKGIFAKSVRGRKATPFLGPAAKKVSKDTGIVAEIVQSWNKAA
jgi:HK97 gp10 family phage protein